MPTKAKKKHSRTSLKKANAGMTVGQLETYIASHMLKKLGLTEAEFVGAKTEIGGEVLDKNTKLKGYSKAKVLKWIKNAS